MRDQKLGRNGKKQYKERKRNINREGGIYIVRKQNKTSKQDKEHKQYINNITDTKYALRYEIVSFWIHPMVRKCRSQRLLNT